VDTYEQKLSHLKTLYHLASADQILTKAEMIFIRNVAERLGVSMVELENIDPSIEPELILPDKEYKIYALFHRLAIIIMLDNEIDERERHFIFNLGVKMGLHPNAINEIVNIISERGAISVTPSEISAIFAKYQN